MCVWGELPRLKRNPSCIAQDGLFTAWGPPHTSTLFLDFLLSEILKSFIFFLSLFPAPLASSPPIGLPTHPPCSSLKIFRALPRLCSGTYSLTHLDGFLPCHLAACSQRFAAGVSSSRKPSPSLHSGLSTTLCFVFLSLIGSQT